MLAKFVALFADTSQTTLTCRFAASSHGIATREER